MIRRSAISFIIFFTLFSLHYLVFAEGFDFITYRRDAAEPHGENPLLVESLDWGTNLLPDAGLVDWSGGLTPMAGRDGFIIVSPDGHFAHEKSNERIRFWGVSIGRDQMDIPMREINDIVDRLSRNGINLVRFTGLDDNAGPRSLAASGTSGEDSSAFHPEVLGRLDYWIARCKINGMYVALVLRDQRRFGPRDGVAAFKDLGSGARGVSIFNERLQDLNIDFARRLLKDRKNRYTHRTLADEPALAFIEIARNDSLFEHVWTDFPEPYRGELQEMWNVWLTKKYGNTDALFTAWRNLHGDSALRPGESLEAKSVSLPQGELVMIYAVAWNLDFGDEYREPPRLRDAYAFALEVQQNSYRKMKEALKNMGVRSLVTNSGLNALPIDQWSIASTLDLTINTFQSLPANTQNSSQPTTTTVQRETINFIRGLDTSCHWTGKPYVEIYYGFDQPTESPEDVGKLMQDIWRTCREDTDAVIFPCEVWPVRTGQAIPDPKIWTLMGPLGEVFRKGLIPPLPLRIGIACSMEDLLVPSFQDQMFVNATRREYFMAEAAGLDRSRFDVIVTSGRTHTGPWASYSNALIFAQAPYPDFSMTRTLGPAESIEASAGYEMVLEREDVTSTNESEGRSRFFDTGIIREKNLMPIGPVEDPKLARAFWDRERQNFIFAGDPWPWANQLTAYINDGFDVYESLGLPVEIETFGPNFSMLFSDWGVMSAGSIDAERVAWENFASFSDVIRLTTGVLNVNNAGNHYMIFALALDGRPLNRTRKLQISGVLTGLNDSPASPTTVLLGNSISLETNQNAGWWECVFDLSERRAWLRCSEPGAAFEFPLSNLSAQCIYLDISPHPLAVQDRRIVWPGGVQYIQLKW